MAIAGASPGSSAPEAARRAVDALSAATKRALALAALVGRDIEVADAERTELRGQGLVTVTARTRVHPRHDLFAQAAIEAVDQTTLAELHLELVQHARTDLDKARHLAAAGRPDEAAGIARRAADAAPTIAARAEALSIVGFAPLASEASIRSAAEALCLAGRYREALDVLDRVATAVPHDELVRARAHWAITEIDRARDAVRAGLTFESIEPADAAELWSLDSRIRTRVEWDLDAGMASAERAISLAAAATGAAATSATVAAQSAFGLAALMAGAPGWAEALEIAGATAMRNDDLHNAVTVYDTMIFGQLLSGDPHRCGALATRMIDFTEHVSAAWNRYFRAAGLLVALHVDSDHMGVLREIAALERMQLSLRSQEMLRSVHTMALVDAGHELDAVGVATDAVAAASDDSARSTALWSLVEAQVAAGLHEEAVRHAAVCAALPAAGFPGSVNAAIAGARARYELGAPFDSSTTEHASSAFPNLQAAAIEVQGIASDDPREALALFRRASVAWHSISRRSSLRCEWAAADAALRAGDEPQAIELLASIDDRAPVWLQRRADATRRALGMTSGAARQATGSEVMIRVARGLTTKQIARSLAVSTSTVETHVRLAMSAIRSDDPPPGRDRIVE